MGTTPDTEAAEETPATPTPPPRRRHSLRAGQDAETDFTIVYPGGGDRVGEPLTVPDPRPRRR